MCKLGRQLSPVRRLFKRAAPAIPLRERTGLAARTGCSRPRRCPGRPGGHAARCRHSGWGGARRWSKRSRCRQRCLRHGGARGEGGAGDFGWLSGMRGCRMPSRPGGRIAMALPRILVKPHQVGWQDAISTSSVRSTQCCPSRGRRPKVQLLTAIEGHVLAHAELVGSGSDENGCPWPRNLDNFSDRHAAPYLRAATRTRARAAARVVRGRAASGSETAWSGSRQAGRRIRSRRGGHLCRAGAAGGRGGCAG